MPPLRHHWFIIVLSISLNDFYANKSVQVYAKFIYRNTKKIQWRFINGTYEINVLEYICHGCNERWKYYGDGGVKKETKG
jgi:pantothenate kinase-related protein Tda10